MWPFSRRIFQSKNAQNSVAEVTTFWRAFVGEIVTSVAVLVPIWIISRAVAIDKGDIEFIGGPLFIAWLSYKHWKRPGILWPFRLPFWRVLWLFILTFTVGFVLPSLFIAGSAYIVWQVAVGHWQPTCIAWLITWLPIIVMRKHLWTWASSIIRSQERGPREAARTVLFGAALLLLMSWQVFRPHEIVVADLCEDAKSDVEDWTGDDFELRTVKVGEPSECSVEWNGEEAIVTIVGVLGAGNERTPERWRVALLPITGISANGRHSFGENDPQFGAFQRLPLRSQKP
jgi:hypothetical protein